MIESARRQGIDELGISDHYALHPDGVELEWSMCPDVLGDYAEAVLQYASSSAPIVRLGIEADYFPETIEGLRERLARVPLDYVIGSVHFVNGFPVDEHARYWNALRGDDREAKWVDYWNRVTALARSGLCDILAHLDLPKKFGHHPREALSSGALGALDAIAEAGMAIELNTAGWSLPAREPYPSEALLRAARARDIPICISADAHTPRDVARHFQRARDLVRACGWTHTARYEGRTRTLVKLP